MIVWTYGYSFERKDASTCEVKLVSLHINKSYIMKKSFLLALLLATTSVLWGKHVPEELARAVAVDFMCARTSVAVSVRNVEAGTDGRAYYIINLNPCGWVIVSADDVTVPIIGYSPSGSLEQAALPDNMRYVMGEYDRQIRQIALLTTEAHPDWTSPHALTRAPGGVKIEPLIQVNWNQDAPYNAYCPQGTALVGCVAVAMSQAMSVQRYPDRPQGSVSYTCAGYGGLSINFDSERAYNWNDILSGSNNYDEAARLMYHAGMSVEMDYGTDGSGIPSNEVSRITDALKENFGYPESVRYIWRDQYDGDWEQLIFNELSAGRAVIYNAVDSRGGYGHSFNMDGYDGDGHFHLNWGWGGLGNGYFGVDNLRDLAMGMDYDAGHVVVIGIGAPDQVLKDITLSNLHIEEGLPAGAVVGQLNVNGEAALPTYRVSVHGTYDAATGTYKEVPFTVSGDMLVTTEELSTSTESWTIEITVEDSESGTSLTQGFRIVVEPWRSLEESTSLRYDRQTGIFHLSTKHNVSYVLRSEQGTELESGMLEPLPELEIDTRGLPAGSFSIELTCGEEKKVIQIIK